MTKLLLPVREYRRLLQFYFEGFSQLHRGITPIFKKLYHEQTFEFLLPKYLSIQDLFQLSNFLDRQ